MTDLLDAASELEQWHRDQALAAARQPQPPGEAPRTRRGKRLCLDCDQAIDKRRLAIVPAAARCAECQAYHDKER